MGAKVLIEEMIAETRASLTGIGFDSYAQKTADDVTLLVSFSTERKRFLVTVFRNEPPEPILSIPVDLTVAESKSCTLFGREFVDYVVVRGEQEGDIGFTPVNLSDSGMLEALQSLVKLSNGT